MREYEELRIRVWSVGAERYLVYANGPASAAEVVRLEQRPEDYRRRLEALLEEEFRRQEPAEPATDVRITKLGRELFAAFFPEPLYRCLMKSLAAVKRDGRGLRLRFDLPGDLAEIPVEALCAPADDPLRTLALHDDLSIVRSLPGLPQNPLRLPQAADKPGRLDLLIVVASPEAHPDRKEPPPPPLDVGKEIGALTAKLPKQLLAYDPLPLRFLGWPRDNQMKRATQNNIRGTLEKLRGPCAVLVIAHGRLEPNGTVVLLEDDHGQVDRVTPDVLAGLLAVAPGLRFVALNLCLGAAAPPSEPFSGFAQALIAKGIPAVTAMRGEVSDSAAALYSPLLFEGITTNKTIDEAQSAGRQRMAGATETRIEWSSPVLFLHESCAHGWLYKLRWEYPSPDPLQLAAKALAQVSQDPTENEQRDPDDYGHATRLPRLRRDWQTTLRLAQAGLANGEPIAHLVREAQGELALRGCRETCELLARDDVKGMMKQLAALATEPIEEIVQCLRSEVRQRLAARLERARRSAEDGAWNEVVQCCDEVLRWAPDGDQDAAPVRNEAASLARLARAHGDAEQSLCGGSWDGARENYRAVLRVKAGDELARRGLAYVEGRLSEDRLAKEPGSGSWLDPAEAYRQAGTFRDAARYLAYAQGRYREEETKQWGDATSAYSDLPETWRDVRQRLAYVRGRAAEDKEEWEVAASSFADAEGHEDAAERTSYARGRLAIENKQWTAATALLEQAGSVDGVDRWRQVAREGLYQAGVQAEHNERWSEALGCFGALPAGFEDSALRSAYAAGRAAELEPEPDWVKAAVAFPSARGYRDSPLRQLYAAARAAAEAGQWAQALAALRDLPDDFLDVPERLLYASGCNAAEKEDWQGVTDGFGTLPDPYENGRVGPLRRYARARLAEPAPGAAHGAHQDDERRWSTVEENLRDVPDSYRDGEAGKLRQYAVARLAEETDWDEAVSTYEDIDPSFRDVKDRITCSRGHAAEKKDWQAALHHYGELPDSYPDVESLRSYAEGRWKEGDGDWPGAATAYGRIGGYRDATDRGGYARAQVSLSDGAWDEALVLLEKLSEDYRDVAQLQAYTRGREAERLRTWKKAVAEYGAAPACRDAPARRCYAQGRLQEAEGLWRRAIESYREAGDITDCDCAARLGRLRGLLEALPAIDGLASARMVAEPVATTPGDAPYRALEPAGISPSSPAEQVKDAASFLLMERGMMTPEIRLAWDQLRTLPSRLRVDAFLHRLRDPVALLRAQQDLSEDDPVAALCEAIDEDAPLLLLLANRREQALAMWEKQLRDRPAMAEIAHDVAIVHFWRARDLEASGAYEQADGSWAKAIACWTSVLSNDGYWDRWRQDAASRYRQPVTPADIARLRADVGQQILTALASQADAYASDGRAERAQKYQELALALEVELEGARALKEAGGLPLPGYDRPLVCGPQYLRLVGRASWIGELVAGLDAEVGRQVEQDDFTILDSLLSTFDGPGHPGRITPELLHHLRACHSELGRGAILLDHHQPEQALRALPPTSYRTRLADLPPDCARPAGTQDLEAHLPSCPSCRHFAERNPAYLCLSNRSARFLQDAVELATRAHLDHAQTVLTTRGSDPQEALGAWKDAIEVSRNVGSHVRTKRAIVRVVLGRVDALMKEHGQSEGERLTDALALIAAARPLIGGADGGQLAAQEAAVLTQRGVWYGYACHEYMTPDFDRAADDLRRALALNPDSLRARDNLARALIFPASSMRPFGDRLKAVSLMAEGLAVLHEGLRRTAGHRQLQDMLSIALKEIEEWFLHELDADELMQRIGFTSAAGSGDGGTSSARELLAAGRRKLEAGDLVSAITILIQAVRRDPRDDDIQQTLIGALQRKSTEA